MSPIRILFVTWDGPQTQYLGRLFLPILGRLVADGHRVTIMQFSLSRMDELAKVRQQCREVGAHFISFPIFKFLGKAGPLLSVILGSLWLSRQNLSNKFDVVIVRSIIPAIVYLLARGKKRTALVFDADGLPVEQRLEFERLKAGGFLHRILQMVEQATLNKSSSVISRSKFGSETLRRRVSGDLSDKQFFQHNNGVGQISSVADQHRAGIVTPRNQGIFGIAYVGSWGAQYRPKDMLRLVIAVKERIPTTVFSVFTGDRQAIDSDLDTFGLLEANWVRVDNLRFDDLQPVLRLQTVGLAFRLRSQTAKAVYPLKIADYFFAGLPVVGDIVGDMEPAIIESGAFWDAGSVTVEETVNWCEELWLGATSSLRETCVSLAESLYSLDKTVGVYREALEHAVSNLSFSAGNEVGDAP